MRRIFLIFGLFISILGSNCLTSSADAVTVSEMLNSKKPYVLLVYTSWSKPAAARENMVKLSKKYKSVTFKSISINNEEAAALFEKGPMTFGGFPYIQMARGKVGSFVDASCARDYACFDKKVKRFFR